MNSGLRPNLFLVGAPKCGTSALALYLAEHNDVYVSEPKEPMFWASDYSGITAREPRPVDSLEKYEAIFRGKGHLKYRADASAIYMSSLNAIPEIEKYNSSARYIAAVRNPIELAPAFHQQLIFAHFEDEYNFEIAWELQSDRSRGNSIPPNCPSPGMLQYKRIASLGEQLERFFQTVPADRRMVIVMDDFRDKPHTAWKSVLDFLKLADDGRKEFPRINAAKAHRFKLLGKLMMSPPPLMRPLVHYLRAAGNRQHSKVLRGIKAFLKKPDPRCPLSPDFRAHLTNEFESDVILLGDLLQRDLTAWLA